LGRHPACRRSARHRPRDGAQLLEKLEPGTELSDQPELPPFAPIAELLTSLRAADEDGINGLPALSQRVEFLFALIGRRLGHPRVRALVTPDVDGDRLQQWCQATAVIIAVQHLYRRPPDDSTELVLRLSRA
jgi:hypothetical protein